MKLLNYQDWQADLFGLFQTMYLVMMLLNLLMILSVLTPNSTSTCLLLWIIFDWHLFHLHHSSKYECLWLSDLTKEPSFFSHFWWDQDSNTGLHTYKAGALSLEPCFQSVFSGCFGDAVLGTIFLVTLPVLASQVARITSVNHWHLDRRPISYVNYQSF
jgi:hypothetical protein